MMKLFLALVLLSAYTAAQSIGYDITGTNVAVVNASSSAACAQQCDGNSKCAGWVWDSLGGSACTLKATITARPADANRISDVRLGEVGYDRSGYDMPGSPYFLASPATASTCSYLCSNTTGCVAWSWTGSYCSVKWWAAARTAAKTAAGGITSGVVGTSGNDWPYVGDLTSSALPSTTSSTACANLCESTSGCVAWSFSLLGSSCSTPNVCYLKKFVPGAVTTGQICRTAALSSQYFNTSIAGAAVNVSSVVPLGNQSDTHLSLTHFNRDGGAVGTLGGNIYWIWADTDVTVNGTWIGMWGNSYAVGTPGNPLQMTGPIGQAIPYTKTESAFNYRYGFSPRVTLWTKTGIIETSPGFGVLHTPKGYWGNTTNTNATNSGIVLSTATIASNGKLKITRLSDEPLWNSSYPSYSTTAAVKDQNFLYLYSSDSIAKYTSNSFIARVPLASATVLSTYEYYYASSQTWQSTPPLKKSSADAIWQSSFGISGNMYYSDYHKVWMFIYQYNADLNVRLRYAKAPQGPFFGDQLIFTSPPPTATGVGYIYGTTGTNLYDYTGKTASTDHTWVTRGTGYKNWVNQVNFQ